MARRVKSIDNTAELSWDSAYGRAKGLIDRWISKQFIRGPEDYVRLAMVRELATLMTDSSHSSR